jgi:DNA-binding NarL/FixJ family response regulator
MAESRGVHAKQGWTVRLTFTVEVPELPRLTPRETTVLECLGRGLTNKETASALGLTESTARSYIAELMQKTRRNRHELGIIGFFLHFSLSEMTKSA